MLLLIWFTKSYLRWIGRLFCMLISPYPWTQYNSSIVFSLPWIKPTATTLKCDPGVPGTCIFNSAFWAFGPCIRGFRHCRPVISIDATYLYGKYKGKLLIAMATDGDNKIYPLAFAVVESESTESWGWFLACLLTYVTDQTNLCIISDRHRGIESCFDDTEHRGYS